MQIKKIRQNKGFTLVEVLIAMTITLVIVGLLMGMTKIAVATWQTTHAKARSSAIAEEVFESVSQDLESMVVRTGNNYEWFRINKSANVSSELGPDTSKEMVNPIELAFFSAVTDRYNGQINTTDDNGGDISAVRYRLIHQDLVGGTGVNARPVFALYRQRIDPDDTFEELLSKTSLDGIRNSAEIVDAENYLVENIFDFTLSFKLEYTLSGVKYFKRYVVRADEDNQNSLSIRGNGITKAELDVDGNGVPLTDSGGGALFPSGASSPKLAGIDVSVLVLSDRGMNGLKTKNITSDAELAQYLKENGHHFSKSIIIPRP